MPSRTVTIAGRDIGPSSPPYIVAEISANHNGDIGRVFALLDAAKAAGAHAVKIQTYTADTLTIDHDGPDFRIQGGLWDGRTLYELYSEASTPWEWHDAIFARARELGLTLFSTPFDDTAVDFLEELGAPAYKIASFEAVDLELIGRVARTGKPLIISTGLASDSEIASAVTTARDNGAEQIVLLHCVSSYPAPIEEMNLRRIPHIAEFFDVTAGLSDHTLGTLVSTSAVCLGAALIEKHITLSRADGGPDASFSLEPNELERLVRDTASAWEALGKVERQTVLSERPNLIFRRSLYAVADILPGETLTRTNVRSIRPGHGLEPKLLPRILGSRARVSIPRGTALSWSMLDI